MNDNFLGLSLSEWQAIGTIALVVITTVYVKLTWNLSGHAEASATSADRSATAAEASASLAVMPFVVAMPGKDDPAAHRRSGNDYIYTFRLTNHGVGVALNTTLEAEFGDGNSVPQKATGQVVNLIPAGDSAVREIHMQMNQPPWIVLSTTVESQDPLGRRYKIVTYYDKSGHITTAHRLNAETAEWDQLI